MRRPTVLFYYYSLKIFAVSRPLRGRKDTLYEGGVRVVGLVAAPGLGLARGTLYPGLVHVTDWFSTLLSLAGGRPRVH